MKLFEDLKVGDKVFYINEDHLEIYETESIVQDLLTDNVTLTVKAVIGNLKIIGFRIQNVGLHCHTILYGNNRSLFTEEEKAIKELRKILNDIET